MEKSTANRIAVDFLFQKLYLFDGEQLGVHPGAIVAYECVCFGGAPGVGGVGIEGGDVAEDGLHDAPLGFDEVLAGELFAVAAAGIAEEALVGGHVL